MAIMAGLFLLLVVQFCQLMFSATAKKLDNPFVHPGVLHTAEDLQRMKTGVTYKQDPWYPGFLLMSQDPLANASYDMQGPLSFATRNATGAEPGKAEISSDAVAAELNALMFYITGDKAHAAKAVQILNGWANTLELLNGTDAQLTAALYGPHFVNAAEILREYYPIWTRHELQAVQNMILDIFYPPASQTTPSATQQFPFLANWGSSGEKAIVSFGVFLDNRTMYNQGLDLYQTFACADLTNMINDFGQNCESGRDQSHTQLGLGNQAELCQVASNQGDTEYWNLLSDRLLTGYEYTAKYNLGHDVPYDPGFFRCGANLVGGPWAIISNSTRGQFRVIYEIAYGHLVQLQGKRMKYARDVLLTQPLEGQDTVNNIGDSTVYGTLRFRRLPGNITVSSHN